MSTIWRKRAWLFKVLFMVGLNVGIYYFLQWYSVWDATYYPRLNGTMSPEGFGAVALFLIIFLIFGDAVFVKDMVRLPHVSEGGGDESP